MTHYQEWEKTKLAMQRQVLIDVQDKLLECQAILLVGKTFKKINYQNYRKYHMILDTLINKFTNHLKTIK